MKQREQLLIICSVIQMLNELMFLVRQKTRLQKKLWKMSECTMKVFYDTTIKHETDFMIVLYTE